MIETDGHIEYSDLLRHTLDRAAATDLRVERDPFDRALTLPGFAARQLGLAGLSEKCQSCPFRTSCGGGQFSHRYQRGTGFRNPSVYCADLYLLIGHIRARLARDLAGLRLPG